MYVSVIFSEVLEWLNIREISRTNSKVQFKKIKKIGFDMDEVLASQETLSIASNKLSNRNENLYRQPNCSCVPVKDNWTYLIRAGPKQTRQDVDVEIRACMLKN